MAGREFPAIIVSIFLKESPNGCLIHKNVVLFFLFHKKY